MSFAGKIKKEVAVGIKATTAALMTFSGTTKSDGVLVSRTIMAYNCDRPLMNSTTQSDATTGEWSISINAGLSETVRIICVGLSGENSGIYEHMVS